MVPVVRLALVIVEDATGVRQVAMVAARADVHRVVVALEVVQEPVEMVAIWDVQQAVLDAQDVLDVLQSVWAVQMYALQRVA